MMLRTKLLAFLAALAASKHAIGGIVTTGVLAAAISPALGFDPWTWVLGAIGGIVVRVKLPPTSRPDSIINGVISVILAGLGAPFLTEFLTFDNTPKPNLYLIAFILAAVWPWVLSALWKVAKRKLDSWGEK